MTVRPAEVLEFWFDEATPAQYFKQDPAFDARIRARFAETHRVAARAELHAWRATPDGRLAEIIVLDQFSRNLFRNSPLAFACDPMALVLAQEAVRLGLGNTLPAARRAFLYLPYMHSESRRIHEEALRLFAQPGLEKNFEFELKHVAIIDRFGRYPHRNVVLGRESTPQELEFLSGPDSSF